MKSHRPRTYASLMQLPNREREVYYNALCKKIEVLRAMTHEWERAVCKVKKIPLDYARISDVEDRKKERAKRHAVSS